MLNAKLFNVQNLNVEYQNDMNVEHQTVLNCLMFNIRMSNVKQFDVRHSNVECQTTNVKPTSM